MASREKIIEKVRRLRRLETSPHKHESAAAKRAADAIVKKYKISAEELAEPKPAPPPAPEPAPSARRPSHRRSYAPPPGPPSSTESTGPTETGPRVDPYRGGFDYGTHRTSGDFTSAEYRDLLRTVWGTYERPGGMPSGFGMPDGFRVTPRRR